MAITHGFSANLGMLLAQACPSDDDIPLFNECMKRARANGLEWNQALLYTIQVREQMDQGELATAFDVTQRKRIGWGGAAVLPAEAVG
ncbi:MAG: hypothetical protein KGK08_02040 [Acidobacteriota bacterium]|nr:hypothetical protein [Acidobacteriota bacterium]